VNEVEYRGLVAETWDLLRGDTSGWADRPFYLARIHEFGEPALDVGCGTGRLLLDYLAEGVDIDGVDVSAEMLDLCRAKAAGRGLAPTLYRQAVEELDLPRRYHTILVPSSTFQLLLEPPAAAQALARMRDHLLPGGVLVMPFMALWVAGEDLAVSEVTEAIRADGAMVRKTARSTFDPETRLADSDDLFEVIRDGEVIASERHVRARATRQYEPAEVFEMAAAAGLDVMRVVAGFTDAAWTPGDRIFTVLLGSR